MPPNTLINADFSQRAVLHREQQQWVASPQQGVRRIFLDRVGAEKARATSIVSYAPGSMFPLHGHPGGEEILVLDGLFSDASGDFSGGWYLRNPPGSHHAPSSAPGATLFVKLRQMPDQERQAVRIDSGAAAWQPRGAGRSCLPLYHGAAEHVELLRLQPDAVAEAELFDGGAEYLVLNGQMTDDDGTYGAGAWLRLPPGARQQVRSGAEGVLFYRKTGHLAVAIG
ncbi:cupin domain-containing protein [Janthinobacterium agaricidamnosum]|uniref:Anti-ECFsigma factor, ChrR n=1 Tax=Janthinobacterium agaricidamnosum NBRC 102515 = DSM 9628 TaxID=1349767 RepID=W0VF50_9BURK|nr:cupin domain-containing protein [Janthinobacterium agaricidamnosum]CDG85967.1 anti-ECFsigma factor, ChrR [Janthinobacterium agaricidamnosum NBRC 102515 = DSM 9628]